MDIQLAIDRISIEKAVSLIKEVQGNVDMVEIGTSLIKEFGIDVVREIRRQFPNLKILADIKTIDQAEYEFRMVYEAGADVATVMGASAIESIEVCQKICQEMKKEYMIDLLEVTADRIKELKVFEDAWFCIHLPADKTGTNLESLVSLAVAELKPMSKIAVAGGITLKHLPFLIENDVSLAIIGGAITKSRDVGLSAKQFADYLGKG